MNTTQDHEIVDVDIKSEQPVSVGKTLRAAREQQGLSISDVANRIKFAPKQIEWLEDDDFTRLPEAAFVRGFVRSYARLVNVDSTRLLSNLPSSHVQSESKQQVASVEIPLSTFNVRRYNIMWLAAALFLALSLALFERMHSSSPDEDVPLTKTKVQELDLPVGKAESDVTKPDVTPVKDATAQEKMASADQKVTAPLTEPVRAQALPPVMRAEELPRVVPAPAATVGQSPSVDRLKVNVISSAAEHALRLEFDADSWVEIKDGDDTVLTSRMHTAGSLVRLNGKSPMFLVIGNAQAVRLFDNGKAINLEKYTSNEVARITLK